jgi:hypothetical protein
MSAEIRNPGYFDESESVDMWEGSSADADMGMGFSCAPRKGAERVEGGVRTPMPESAVRPNGLRPRNP